MKRALFAALALLLASTAHAGATIGGNGGSGGGVTSVAMTVPTILNVAGSPVTTSGTFALTLANQSANTVLAGPTTGSAAPPAFRAIVAADLPATAVTAGSYTTANITVDAQGRITAAANGTSGSGTVAAGTVNSIAKYTGSTTVGNSLWTDDGTTGTYTGAAGLAVTGPIATGTGSGNAGAFFMGQGLAPTLGSNQVVLSAPLSVSASFNYVTEGSAGSSGYFFGTVSGTTVTWSKVAASGTGNVALTNGATFVAPILGTPASGTLTNCTGLPQAGTVGLTTADSPQFAGLNVGNATDTTITRVSAGVIAVEGATIATQTYADSSAKATILGTFASPDTAAGALTWTTGVIAVTTSAAAGVRTYLLPAASSYTGKGFWIAVGAGANHVNLQPQSGAALVLAGVLLTANHYIQAATSAAGNYICGWSDGTNWQTLGSAGTWADAASP